jgi:16S rRNA G1207 methylase RsmC
LPDKDAEAKKFDALRDTLKAGVQVVSAPQLFPTPEDLAQRMAEVADIHEGQRLLEPSAGLGAIIRAMIRRPNGTKPPVWLDVRLVAVEISFDLCAALRAAFPSQDVHCKDFLTCNANLGTFDRIVMNPPFANGADIKHILHAKMMLNPGGRLVAICANGPRQQEQLQPLCDMWEALPADTFSEQGTNVNTALILITA